MILRNSTGWVADWRTPPVALYQWKMSGGLQLNYIYGFRFPRCSTYVAGCFLKHADFWECH
uniref:Uncharacterized protein n=1 Tax=Anguilla anguilla TaxID=7936 RepID=A0A0E9TU61_ANGAN